MDVLELIIVTVWTHRRSPKVLPRCPKPPQDAQRCSQGAPNTPKDVPKTAKDAPKTPIDFKRASDQLQMYMDHAVAHKNPLEWDRAYKEDMLTHDYVDLTSLSRYTADNGDADRNFWNSLREPSGF